jgi:hypothetical protein
MRLLCIGCNNNCERNTTQTRTQDPNRWVKDKKNTLSDKRTLRETSLKKEATYATICNQLLIADGPTPREVCFLASLGQYTWNPLPSLRCTAAALPHPTTEGIQPQRMKRPASGAKVDRTTPIKACRKWYDVTSSFKKKTRCILHVR